MGFNPAFKGVKNYIQPYPTPLRALRMAISFTICFTQELRNFAVDRGFNSIA
jgi:hypothetical protein